MRGLAFGNLQFHFTNLQTKSRRHATKRRGIFLLRASSSRNDRILSRNTSTSPVLIITRSRDASSCAVVSEWVSSPRSDLPFEFRWICILLRVLQSVGRGSCAVLSVSICLYATPQPPRSNSPEIAKYLGDCNSILILFY